MTKYFYDTNACLELQDKIFESSFVISSKTLEEIENIKTSQNKDSDIKYRARKLSHLLDDKSDAYQVAITYEEVFKVIEDFYLMPTPDNIILASAFLWNKEEEIIFKSDDINAKVIGREVFGLNVCGVYESHNNEIYKGYKTIDVSNDKLADFYGDLNINWFDCLTNEYAILKNNNTVDIYKWVGNKYVPINSRGFKSRMFGNIRPLDDIQRCAFDSIASNEITVLHGKAGSGKTTIPLAYIMQHLETQKVKKCHIVFHYEPLKGAKTLGFEKGSHVEKILNTGALGNILSTKFGDIQIIESMISSGTLNIIPTANIRGVEFGAEDIVFVTEAQSLDVYTLKTIVQRCKSGCKQIYEGDILEQADIVRDIYGIDRLTDVFKGYEKFGCIELKNNYRSPICELADKM